MVARRAVGEAGAVARVLALLVDAALRVRAVGIPPTLRLLATLVRIPIVAPLADTIRPVGPGLAMGVHAALFEQTGILALGVGGLGRVEAGLVVPTVGISAAAGWNKEAGATCKRRTITDGRATAYVLCRQCRGRDP